MYDAVIDMMDARQASRRRLSLSKVEGMGVPVTRVTGTGTGAERRPALA